MWRQERSLTSQAGALPIDPQRCGQWLMAGESQDRQETELSPRSPSWSVHGRLVETAVKESWLTPSGGPRSAAKLPDIPEVQILLQ